MRFPPSKVAYEDKLIWVHSSKGVISVKSADHTEVERKKQQSGESSKANDKDERWSCMWTLKIPGIIKTFMWRAGNDLLATKKNLFNIKCSGNSMCSICLGEEETVLHVILQCPAANTIWVDFNSPVQKWKMEEDDLLTLWEKFMNTFSTTELEWIATTLRRVWLRRNEYVFENKLCSPIRVIQQ